MERIISLIVLLLLTSPAFAAYSPLGFALDMWFIQEKGVWHQFALNGPLFPYLRTVRAGDRATEFHQRCVGLNIKGVTLHSYRYAWAERAKTAGYPERFAQEALGHNSNAVHRAYARKAKVELPSLGEYERQRAAFARGTKTSEPW
jgi:integrase